jgi:hypothetical protein
VKRYQALLPWLLALSLGWPLADAHAVEVFEVQGNGMASPMVGQSVTINDSIVTAVFNGGFFLQTPDARADSPAALTSNGIRVLTAGFPSYGAAGNVAVGDRATVSGTVIEQHGETRLQMSSATRHATGQPLPSAVEFSLQASRPRAHFGNLFCFDNLSNFECFEGMRVSLPDAMVVAGNLIAGGIDYGPVYVSPFGRRSMREKGVRMDDSLTADNLAAGYWDSNPEILRMQADRLGAVAPNTPLVGGARFSAVGILTVVDGAYTFWPTQITIDAASNVLPVSAGVPETASSFRIGTFDLGRLCDANPGNSSEPCRVPEPGASEVNVQVNRLAAYIVEALGAPEVLAVQQVETQAMLDALAGAASAQAAAGVTYSGLLGGGNDPRGLKLGYLIRTDKISVIGLENRLTGATHGGRTLHPMPPLLFEGSFSDGGNTHRFRVLNVHIDERDGVDSGNAALRERRFQQALSIAGLIQTLQTDGDEVDAPLMVVGKLNGWTRTDGYADVHALLIGHYYDPENLLALGADNPVSPVLTSIMDLLPSDQQISTMTTVSFGPVQGESNRTIPAAVGFDHIMLSHDARRTTTAYGLARANADAPQFLREFGSGAVGSSPYDGLVVRMYPGCLNDPAANQDGDAWCDLFDNCPTVPNDDQADSNGSGVGDACEAQGDLGLSLGATPNPAEPGQNVTVTATVNHLSGATVDSPTLSLQLPRRFALQSVNPGPWSCNSVAPGTKEALIQCTMSALGSGGAILSAVGVPDPDLPTGALLQIEAELMPPDTDPSNNSASVALAITAAETDLRLIMINPSPATTVGAELDFTLILNNLGQRTAEDVVVRMPRPAGTQISVIDADAGWNCNAAGPAATQLECTRTSYAAGSQSDIRFSLTVLPSAGTSFNVSAEIDSSTPDPDPSNNSQSVTFTVSDGDPQGDRIFRDGFEGG